MWLVTAFLNIAIKINVKQSFYMLLIMKLLMSQPKRRTYCFGIDPVGIGLFVYFDGRIMLHANYMPSLMIWLKWMLIDTA